MTIFQELKHFSEIETCEKLPINYKLWGTEKDMEAFGQMGYIAQQEWVVKLTAKESDPLAVFFAQQDPVYLDSALEVFLNFDVSREYYINLEVNANGALLCHYGKRKDRGPILSEEKVRVLVNKNETEWSVILRIPYSIIEKCFGNIKLQKGSDISFNLYKICEREDERHFISHTFIPTAEPDFHMPQYFAHGKLG